MHIKRELEHFELKATNSRRPHLQLGGLQRDYEASLVEGAVKAKGVA
jgi:hypothetical protein